MARFQGDLPERAFEFSLRILDLIDLLPEGTKGWELGRQILRSGTSIGANISEADGALTDAEFTHMCNIARREAAETTYWLHLCSATFAVAFPFQETIEECAALHNILAAIVRKMQTKKR